MMKGSRAGVPFLAIGIAFVAIGMSTQRAFLAIGIAFVALGIALLVRQRRAGG